MFFIKRLPNTQVKNNDVVFEQTDEMDAWMKCNAVKRFIFKGMMTLFFIFGLLVSNFAFADQGLDPLAAAIKPQVQALFGAGSTVAYCIYIAEIIFGSVVYVKTKNLLTLLGVPILVLFTHAMFTYIGS